MVHIKVFARVQYKHKKKKIVLKIWHKQLTHYATEMGVVWHCTVGHIETVGFRRVPMKINKM